MNQEQTTEQQPDEPDEFHGQGGSYVRENGIRRRVVEPDLAASVRVRPAVERGDRIAHWQIAGLEVLAGAVKQMSA